MKAQGRTCGLGATPDRPAPLTPPIRTTRTALGRAAVVTSPRLATSARRRFARRRCGWWRYAALCGARRGRLLNDASAAGACPREQAVDSFDGVRLRFSALLAMEQGQAGHGAITGIVVRLLEPAA